MYSKFCCICHRFRANINPLTASLVVKDSTTELPVREIEKAINLKEALFEVQDNLTAVEQCAKSLNSKVDKAEYMIRNVCDQHRDFNKKFRE